MKRKLMTISTIALIGGTAAFAQEINPGATQLNETLYAQGIAAMTPDNFEVKTVRQDAAGNMTFYGERDGMYRVLVINADGTVASDEMSTEMAGPFDNPATPEDESDSYAVNGEITDDILPDGGRKLNGDLDVDGSVNLETQKGAGAERTESIDGYTTDGDVSADPS